MTILYNIYNFYFFLPIFLFFISIFGIIFHRKNVILVLMCIELMLFSINLYFVFSSIYLDDLLGQIFAIFILTVAAAESAIGLAILVVHHRLCNTIIVESLGLLKG